MGAVDMELITLITVSLIGLSILVGSAWLGYKMWLKYQEPAGIEPAGIETEALDAFESHILKLQREQNRVESNLADLRHNYKGMTEVLISFLDDLADTKSRLRIVNRGDIDEVRGGIAFYDADFAALLGSLDQERQRELLHAEVGFLTAEVEAVERYAQVVLNRIISVRGAIAHTQLKLRKSHYVAVLQDMSDNLLECETKLEYLNEPQYQRTYLP